ncbi:MAG TPA: MEDS domain-containing protein [Candidatus Aquilonibacter sp.]|nr:MEDS domain-containing protein [Candidatus Aquilonibacter sp.]
MDPALSHRPVPSRALRHGDHALLLYSSSEERTDAVVPFVAEGLRRNDRVLCVGDGIATPSYERLGSLSRDALRSGQLIVENSAHTYMRGGHFSGSRMKAHYRAAARLAQAEGFGGLRIAAEMSWAAHAQAQPLLPLVEYEATLDQALHGESVTVLCEYDTRLFDTAALKALEQAHAIGARPDPLFASHRLRIERAYSPNGLALTGELDIAARGALHAALSNVIAPGIDRPVVDLRALSYIDAGSLGALVAASERSARGIEVVVNARIARLLRALRTTLPPSLEIREAGDVL